MALSIITPKQEFSTNDSDDLLANEPFGDDYENSLRPSLADKLQVGFLISDQYTQTCETEVFRIKDMTDTVKILVEDMDKVKRDFEFNKQVIKATFQQKLEDKAFELYSKLNEKLHDLRKMHEERVGIIRRSFKQQLQDALVKMAAHYKNYYEKLLAGKLPSDEAGRTKAKLSSLESDLFQKQTIIDMLEAQIKELREQLAAKPATEIKIDTSQLDAAQEQNKSLLLEISNLNDRVDDLIETVGFREEKIKEINFELGESREEIEKHKDTCKRLALQIEELKQKMEFERRDSMKILSEQKESMERDLAARMADAENQSAKFEKDRQAMLEKIQAEMNRQLNEERKNFERRLSEMQEEAERREMQLGDVKTLQIIIQQQKSEIFTLKQRLARSQKQWEKKFTILRASLHALKDESYVRAQLQKQAATLKYASISYGPDGAAQNASEQNPSHAIEPGPHQPKPYLPATKPLPSIKRGGRIVPGKPTNTIPSGMENEPFSDDEEQDEYQDMEDGFVPLPPKPSAGDYLPAISSN